MYRHPSAGLACPDTPGATHRRPLVRRPWRTAGRASPGDPSFRLAAFTSVFATFFLVSAFGDDAHLVLDRPVELNAERQFEVPAQVRGGCRALQFRARDGFRRGFSAGESGEQERGARADSKPPATPHVVAAGRNSGSREARVPLASELEVSFGLFALPPQPGATFNIRAKTRDNKLYVSVRFFQRIVRDDNGRSSVVASTSSPKFSGSPSTWLPRTAPFPVTVRDAENALCVELAGDDTDLARDMEAPDPGVLALQFRRVSFIIGRLRTSTRLDDGWCEVRLDRLRSRNILSTGDSRVAAEGAEAQAQKLMRESNPRSRDRPLTPQRGHRPPVSSQETA